MKRNLLFLLLAGCLALLYSGCSAPIRTGIQSGNKNFVKVLKPEDKIIIVDANHFHEGSAATNTFFSVWVKMAVDASYEKLPYVFKLDDKCIEVIENTFSSNRIFTYEKDSGLKKLIFKNHTERNKISSSEELDSEAKKLKEEKRLKDLIKTQLAEKNADYAITMKLVYSYVPGFSKPLYLAIGWDVYDKESNKVVHAFSAFWTEEGVEAFPNTTDPRWEKIFTELAEKNAEDFLAAMAGKEPVQKKELAFETYHTKSL